MQIIIDGFTYGGDLILSLFNYIIIGLTLSPFFSKVSKDSLPKGIVVLVIAIIVQVILWFLFNAQGVSVVWNMLAGCLLISVLIDKMRRKKTPHLAIYIILLLVILTNIYFALIFPTITTYAHILAIILGSLIGAILLSLGNK